MALDSNKLTAQAISSSRIIAIGVRCPKARRQQLCSIHVKNSIWIVHGDIWIIHGGTRKITVCSSTFYGVDRNFCYRHSQNYIYIKIIGMNGNFYILHHEKLLCSIFGYILYSHPKSCN